MRLTGEQIFLHLGFLQHMAYAMTEEDLLEFSKLAGRLLDGPPSEEDEEILLQLVSKFTGSK